MNEEEGDKEEQERKINKKTMNEDKKQGRKREGC
jgi:hypothetical protein